MAALVGRAGQAVFQAKVAPVALVLQERRSLAVARSVVMAEGEELAVRAAAAGAVRR